MGLIEIKLIAKKKKKIEQEEIEALSMWNAMLSLLAFSVNCIWKYVFEIINLNIWNSNILLLHFLTPFDFILSILSLNSETSISFFVYPKLTTLIYSLFVLFFNVHNYHINTNMIPTNRPSRWSVKYIFSSYSWTMPAKDGL